jgi:hypothetical protein
MVEGKPDRFYSIVGPGSNQPPNYARVVSTLTVAELEQELAAGRGSPGYLEAVEFELEARGNARSLAARPARCDDPGLR